MRRENAAESIGAGLENESMPLAPELVVMMKEEVNRIKNQKLPVNKAFEAIAKKSGLKFNTVRNYYYRYIHEKDKKRRDVNQPANSGNRGKRDQGVAGNSFKETEVRNLIMTILQAQAQGESVRSCANRLANNDPKLMLRYQNKYRNVIAKKQEYVKALMAEMDRQGIKYYDPFRKKFVDHSNTIRDRDKENDSLEEDFLGIVGQLMADIREISGESLIYFFKGLRDLSRMAVLWKKQQEQLNGTGIDFGKLGNATGEYSDILKEKDCKIQELNAKILSYEARIEDYKNNMARLMSMFHQLMSLNRNFLNLSSAGKLTGLQDYTKELENLIKGYDAEIAN